MGSEYLWIYSQPQITVQSVSGDTCTSATIIAGVSRIYDNSDLMSSDISRSFTASASSVGIPLTADYTSCEDTRARLRRKYVGPVQTGPLVVQPFPMPSLGAGNSSAGSSSTQLITSSSTITGTEPTFTPRPPESATVMSYASSLTHVTLLPLTTYELVSGAPGRPPITPSMSTSAKISQLNPEVTPTPKPDNDSPGQENPTSLRQPMKSDNIPRPSSVSSGEQPPWQGNPNGSDQPGEHTGDVDGNAVNRPSKLPVSLQSNPDDISAGADGECSLDGRELCSALSVEPEVIVNGQILPVSRGIITAGQGVISISEAPSAVVIDGSITISVGSVTTIGDLTISVPTHESTSSTKDVDVFQKPEATIPGGLQLGGASRKDILKSEGIIAAVAGLVVLFIS